MSYGLPKLGLAVIAMLIAIAPVSAAESPASRPATTAPAKESWPTIFSDLSSADPQTREAARTALMRLNRADLPELREIVAKARPIRPAQAAALHDIVQEIFLAGEKFEVSPGLGFLGVIMDEADSQIDVVQENDLHRAMGVIVCDRFPGFCAARNLVTGDIILGIASPFTPFRSRLDLTGAVGGLKPGTVVRLVILRRGQVITLTLTLDHHPADSLLQDGGVSFRAERQRKFDAYWLANFKPLLSQQLG
jgi:hypothetical protein